MTLMKVLHTVGFGDRTTVHGFRSSFRTWAGECTESDHAVMELCLSHAVGNAVERAYARSDLLEKRRGLMEQWGAVCAAPWTDDLPKPPRDVCPGLDGPNPSALSGSVRPRLASPDYRVPIPHDPTIDIDPAAVPAGRLTTDLVLATTKPGRYSDGYTLFLNVTKGGSKSWIQRITIGGRRRDIGLGGFPAVSLAKARARALANRVALSEGRDPLAETRDRRAHASAGSRRALPSAPLSRANPAAGPTDSNPHRAAAVPNISECVNDTCPWSGEPVRVDSLTRYRGRVVGFCNPGCRDKFQAAVRHFDRSAG